MEWKQNDLKGVLGIIQVLIVVPSPSHPGKVRKSPQPVLPKSQHPRVKGCEVWDIRCEV